MTARSDFTWAELGQRIRDRRLAAEKSQQMLASAAGITQNAVFHIEVGDVNPQLRSLQGIAKELKCTVRELLCGKPDADTRFSGDLARVLRVLESDDPAAVAALKGGLAAAEGLLDCAGRHPAAMSRAAKKRARNPIRRAGSISGKVATKAQDGFAARGKKNNTKQAQCLSYGHK